MTKNKKLAVVLGGWHYPYAYYKQIVNQKIPSNWECDYFVVSHRDPELPIVFEEKQNILETRGDGILQSFDKDMYSQVVTKQDLSDMGYVYNEEKSSIGDLYQLNQWVQRHYNGQYDKVLFSHDDNYMLNDHLFLDILECKVDLFLNVERNKVTKVDSNFDWKHLSSGVLENTITPRTSFTFLDKELLDHIAPEFEEITTRNVDLDRTGETDNMGMEYYGTSYPTGGLSMKDWEKPLNEFFGFMYEEELLDTIRYLSPVYRVSNYCIEGERGLLSNMATPQSGNYNRVVNELDLGAILD